MTDADFDAAASSTRSDRGTRRATDRSRWERPIVRVAWLVARLVRREPVTVELYRRRFRVSLRTFRRDIANVRDAGMYLDPDPLGNYRMVCFSSDSDAA